MSSAHLLEFSSGIAKKQMEKKAWLPCIFLSSTTLGPPSFSKDPLAFQSSWCRPSTTTSVSREQCQACDSPIPHSAWWPGACSGRKPLTPPGLLAKQPWMMKSVSTGVRVSSLRVPRGSPPACAVPPTEGGSPSLLLAAVTAAVRPLPPGMCHRPECSKEISQAGA